MSSTVDILTSGYATQYDTQEGKFMKATGSCALVRSNGLLILFDTMGPWERDLLISRLEELKIHTTDIDYLVCSHSHPDHIGNLNLFLKAKKHIIGTSVYTKDVYDLNCFEPIGDRKIQVGLRNIEYIEYAPLALSTDLEVHHTPGHTMECITMIVSNCDKLGRLGLVGDLYEREEDLRDEGIWLSAGSQVPDSQRAHRSRMFGLVDHILPGHGPLFKTKS